MCGVLFLIVLCFLSLPVFAEIKLQKDPNSPSATLFDGTLILTFSDGRISLLEPSDEIPEIVPGTILEVLNGKFMVATGTDEQVVASCLGQNFDIGGGGSVSLSCGEQSGLLKVNSGTATVKDETGNPKTINAGEEYKIELRAAPSAKPTAATEESSFDLDEIEVPDSRSFEASPKT